MDFGVEIQHRFVCDPTDSVAMLFAEMGKEVGGDSCYHCPEYRNAKGDTVAFILTKKKQYVNDPKWRHKPELQDADGNTIAMILAMNGMRIDEWWRHDPFIRNNAGATVEQFLIEFANSRILAIQNRVRAQITEFSNWEKNEKLIEDLTDAMRYAIWGKVIPTDKFHRADFMNSMKMTVAMYMANNTKLLMKQYGKEWTDELREKMMSEWIHNSALTNEDGYTVAMILAMNKKPIPPIWRHDPKMKNNKERTVFDISVIVGFPQDSHWDIV